MTPHHFKGEESVLEAPPAYDHHGPLGEIVGLPVQFFSGAFRGYRSVWRPSPEELALLNAGGGIMLDVIAPAVFPVALNVCEPSDVLVSV